jgi:hypothetical protein
MSVKKRGRHDPDVVRDERSGLAKFFRIGAPTECSSCHVAKHSLMECEICEKSNCASCTDVALGMWFLINRTRKLNGSRLFYSLKTPGNEFLRPVINRLSGGARDRDWTKWDVQKMRRLSCPTCFAHSDDCTPQFDLWKLTLNCYYPDFLNELKTTFGTVPSALNRRRDLSPYLHEGIRDLMFTGIPGTYKFQKLLRTVISVYANARAAYAIKEAVDKYNDEIGGESIDCDWIEGKGYGTTEGAEAVRKMVNGMRGYAPVVDKEYLIKQSKLGVPAHAIDAVSSTFRTPTNDPINDVKCAFPSCMTVLAPLDHDYGVMGCGHVFCYPCYRLILHKKPATTCPVCHTRDFLPVQSAIKGLRL